MFKEMLKQQNITYIFLILIVVTLPLHERLNSFIIFLFAVYWLGGIISGIFKFRLHKNAWLFIVFYALHLIGLVYTPSQNFNSARFNVEVKLSFIILPLIFSTIPPLPLKRTRNVLQAFVISCCSFSVITLGYALYRNYQLNQLAQFESKFFTNSELIKAFAELHPSYYSLYLSFCLFIILYFATTHKYSKKLIALLGILQLYIFIIILLLGGRMVILTLLTISFTIILFYSFKTNKKLIGISLIIGLLGLTALFFLAIPTNWDRLKKAINYKNDDIAHYRHSGVGLRLSIWDCAMDIISKKPLIGYGTGEAQDKLEQCYRAKKYYALYYWIDIGKGTRFNAHNQYFQTLIALGIVGLLSLLSITWYPFFLSIKAKNYLFSIFLLLFFGLMLTEATFKVQKGVTFFTLFSCIFLFHFPIGESNSSHVHQKHRAIEND